MIKRTLLIVALLFLFFIDVDAQCAMCKAVLESEKTYDGASVSGGINNGILYLMAFPYILIASFLLVNYRRELRKMLADAF